MTDWTIIYFWQFEMMDFVIFSYRFLEVPTWVWLAIFESCGLSERDRNFFCNFSSITGKTRDFFGHPLLLFGGCFELRNRGVFGCVNMLWRENMEECFGILCEFEWYYWINLFAHIFFVNYFNYLISSGWMSGLWSWVLT